MGTLKHIDLDSGYTRPFWCGAFAFWLIALIIFLYSGVSIIYSVIVKLLDVITPEQSVAQIPTSGVIISDQPNGKAGEQPSLSNHLFDKSLWEFVSSGTISFNIENQGFYLANSAKSAQIKYRTPVSFGKNFNFRIVPLSLDVLNFVITRNDMYEITIGDNDMKTVSLKAAKTEGTTMDPVEEKNFRGIDDGNPYRPQLLYPFLAERELTVSIYETDYDNGIVQVKLVLQYVHDDSTDSLVSQEFEFDFVPMARWEKKDTISIGLIRGGAEGEVGVTILEPKIDLNDI